MSLKFGTLLAYNPMLEDIVVAEVVAETVKTSHIVTFEFSQEEVQALKLMTQNPYAFLDDPSDEPEVHKNVRKTLFEWAYDNMVI